MSLRWTGTRNSSNPAARQFGRYGMLDVRYGKARGQPLRRRNVLSVIDWAVAAVADHVENARRRFGCADRPTLRVTGRGGRTKSTEINAGFVAYRDGLKLPKERVPGSPNKEDPMSPLYTIEISLFCTPISPRVAARRLKTRVVQEN
jgi:hypothetical protein